MPEKIKNISSETLVFETFTINQNQTQTLTWSVAFMTPKTFGKMVAMYEEGKVAFYDASDVEITGTLDFNYYTRDQNGVLSSNQTENDIPQVKKLLNDKFNAI